MQKRVLTVIAAAVFSAAAFAQTNSTVNGSANGTMDATAKPGTAATSAQTSAAQSANVGNQAQAGAAESATLNAELTKPVDAKKAKEGDQVLAKTTADTTTSAGTRIPRNTKLVGHVTEAKAKAKGESQSTLSFVFDKAVLKGGQEVPLHAVIQAVAAAPQAPISSDFSGGTDTGMPAPNAGAAPMGSSTTNTRASSNGGVVGNTASTVGAATNTAAGAVNSAAGAAGAATQAGAAGGTAILNAQSTGAVGLKDVQLTQATNASGATSAPSLTSTSGNVHLDSGTQLVLKSASVSANAGADASKQ